MHKRPGNEQPPFHTAGQPPHIFIYHLAELDIVEQLSNALAALFARHTVQASMQFQIFPYGQILVKIDMLRYHTYQAFDLLSLAGYILPIIGNTAGGWL